MPSTAVTRAAFEPLVALFGKIFLCVRVHLYTLSSVRYAVSQGFWRNFNEAGAK
jgi:hypothetical protein